MIDNISTNGLKELIGLLTEKSDDWQPNKIFTIDGIEYKANKITIAIAKGFAKSLETLSNPISIKHLDDETGGEVNINGSFLELFSSNKVKELLFYMIVPVGFEDFAEGLNAAKQKRAPRF